MMLVLAGRTASGKSSLARAIGARLGFPVSGFGRFVRSLVPDPHGEIARGRLQAVGQAAVEQDPAAFAGEFLKWSRYEPARGLIADGLRHTTVWDALKKISHSQGFPLGLVFVTIDDDERVRRLRARGLSDADIATIETHASERDVLSGLEAQADICVHGADSLDANCQHIVARFQGLQSFAVKGPS